MSKQLNLFKILTALNLCVLIGSEGCASQSIVRSASNPIDPAHEIEVVQSEIEVALQGLARFQKDLLLKSTTSNSRTNLSYTVDERLRDMREEIKILEQARDRLLGQRERLRKKFLIDVDEGGL